MTKNSAQLLRHWIIDGRIILWFKIGQSSFPNGTVFKDELSKIRLRGFALAFDRLAKASTFVFNAQSSDFISEVSCSLYSYSSSINSVTNLFKP